VETVRKRQEEFRLFRDKCLLFLGTVGLVGMGLAAVFIGFKNEAIALSLIVAFSGLLGAPTVMRLDEKRGRQDQ
jgi:hypothetical protein